MKYENENPLERLEAGEPYFFVRAKDTISVPLVDSYAGLLDAAAAALELTPEFADRAEVIFKSQELRRNANDVRQVAQNFRNWQKSHKVKLPD